MTTGRATRSRSSCSRTRSSRIADEMALTILRTAYSGVLKDNMDYSTAFADGEGRTVAQGLMPARPSRRRSPTRSPRPSGASATA